MRKKIRKQICISPESDKIAREEAEKANRTVSNWLDWLVKHHISKEKLAEVANNEK
jgi:DNA-binding transcriptional regulator YhcF (GntR family)